MYVEWLDRFVWYSAGTGLIEFEPSRGVGVDWQLVQTRAGRLFVLIRGATELGHGDLQVMLQIDSPERLLGTEDGAWGPS